MRKSSYYTQLEEKRNRSLYWIINGSKKTNNMPNDFQISNIFRPKNGHELLKALKENKKCEIVDTHAYLATKALEDNHCGFSFSFKLSRWNKGWAGFERS